MFLKVEGGGSIKKILKSKNKKLKKIYIKIKGIDNFNL